MGVTDVPLVARHSDLSGAALAAAAPVQDGAHPRGAVGSLPTLAGPLAELPPLSRSPPVSRGQLPIVLSPAEDLGEENTSIFTRNFLKEQYSEELFDDLQTPLPW